MGRLKNNELEQELQLLMDILKQSPNYILSTFTVNEWDLIVKNEPYSGITLYRLLNFEQAFNEVDEFLYSVPIRDWYIRNQVESALHM